MRISPLVLLLVAIFGTISVNAQEKSNKTELIGRFATLTRSSEIDVKINLSLDDVKSDMSSLIEGDTALSESQKQELRKVASGIFSNLTSQTEKSLSESPALAKMGEQVVVGIYDKTFTEKELVDLIAFYSSPLGQKALDFLAKSKNLIEQEFKTQMESKIQEISRPLINSSIDELKRRVKEVKSK